MEKTRREKSYSRRYCSFKEGNEVVRSSRFKNSVHSKGEVFEEVFVTLKGAHLREEFVDDGEREFVDFLVAVLLESLNLVQTRRYNTRITNTGHTLWKTGTFPGSVSVRHSPNSLEGGVM